MMETASATVASLAIAPLVSIIDQAITSNASGREKMLPSMMNSFKSLLSNPIRFMKMPSVVIMTGVYTGTYSAANLVDAVYERSDHGPSTTPKLIASAATNITLINLKDIAYARLFSQGVTRPFPRFAIGLFALRDAGTILPTFSPLPGMLSREILQPLGVPSPDTLALLVTPMSVQVFSTPLHLIGLDLYNREKVTWKDRLSFVRREFAATTVFRMARALPAFGVGGVINKNLRTQGRDYLLTREETVPYRGSIPEGST